MPTERDIMIENAKTYERNGNYVEAYDLYCKAALSCSAMTERKERDYWFNRAEKAKERI